ncbi:hypothetical protein LTR78_005191 [Recurvomyces mirabilis]|uniref:Uncharacterized protein n=1 Tax=Recurvomyces mirabilis TaxID=574656 RepID=A0AAE1C1J9_9PEZI|nr:hypothetical protein LTR78_005191 [Recurvomyces mirabilis]KAK5157741.1 hypothetical protein LTS14_003663 [Recurvomyces mirabilis]
MRFFTIAVALGAVVNALPLASDNTAAIASAIVARDILDDIPGAMSTPDIPGFLERHELTGTSRVDTMLQRAQLSRRSSALGLLKALGYSSQDFRAIMEVMNIRINADINHLFKNKGTWYDHDLDDMFQKLGIEY